MSAPIVVLDAKASRSRSGDIYESRTHLGTVTIVQYEPGTWEAWFWPRRSRKARVELARGHETAAECAREADRVLRAIERAARPWGDR
jgi:hypothetical protein